MTNHNCCVLFIRSLGCIVSYFIISNIMLTVCGMARKKEEGLEGVRADMMRNISRWVNCSKWFTDWNWFVKHTFELSINGKQEEYELISSNFEHFVTTLNNLRHIPKHTQNSNPKTFRVYKSKFMHNQKYFWQICFGQDLPYKIVKDERFSVGFKIVARNDRVTTDEITEHLIGFFEPVENVLPQARLRHASEDEKEGLIDIIGSNYNSIIVNPATNKASVLFGPIQYANHRCRSEFVYNIGKTTVKDNYTNHEQTTVQVSLYDEEVATAAIFNANDEITVRYVLDAKDLYFDCFCTDCQVPPH